MAQICKVLKTEHQYEQDEVHTWEVVGKHGTEGSVRYTVRKCTACGKKKRQVHRDRREGW